MQLRALRKKISKKKKSSGLYYKNITIVIDASKVASEWRHYLEHHMRSSVTVLELSIMLLENIYSTGVNRDNLNMMINIMIVICL